LILLSSSLALIKGYFVATLVRLAAFVKKKIKNIPNEIHYLVYGLVYRYHYEEYFLLIIQKGLDLIRTGILVGETNISGDFV